MRYELEVISPLHIGSGEKLTRFDYVWKNGTLYVVDFDKLMQEVEKKKPKSSDLVQALEQSYSMNMVLEKININLNAITRYSLAYSEKPGDISQQIRNAFGCCYVPGSALKGAIRTALAWAMLEQEVCRFNFNSLNYKKEEAAKKLEGQWFSNSNGKKLGGSDANYDFMRALHIGDSLIPCDAGALSDQEHLVHLGVHCLPPVLKKVQVYTAKSGKLKPRPKSTPWVEALAKGAICAGNWSLDTYLLKDKTGELGFAEKKAGLLEDIPSHVKNFTHGLIEREINFYKVYGLQKNIDAVQTIVDFYQKLLEANEDLKSNEFLLQMSWGTGWYGKTVGLMLDTQADVKAAVREKYKLGKPRGKDEKGRPLWTGIFPETRRLVVRNDKPVEPLGWVKITLLEDSEEVSSSISLQNSVSEATEKLSQEAPETGTVGWFNAERGCGVIIPNGDPEQYVFVHRSAVKGKVDLCANQRVEFIREEGGMTPRAVDVQFVGTTATQTEQSIIKPNTKAEIHEGDLLRGIVVAVEHQRLQLRIELGNGNAEGTLLWDGFVSNYDKLTPAKKRALRKGVMEKLNNIPLIVRAKRDGVNQSGRVQVKLANPLELADSVESLSRKDILELLQKS